MFQNGFIRKAYFNTFPEFVFAFIATVIVLLFVGLMILCIVIEKRDSNDYETFNKQYPNSLNFLNFRQYCGLDSKLKKEVHDVVSGLKKLEDTTQLKNIIRQDTVKTEKSIDKDLYDRWVTFTDNPKKLTRQEFNALAEKDLITELKFYNWCNSTGNPKHFTKEQFDVLKEKGLLTFEKN
jgi:hypothetical protein